MSNIALEENKSKSIVGSILSAITEEQKNEKRWSPLRMSNSGKCARLIAYQLHEFPSTPLPARSIMVFRLGHTIESELKLLIDKYCSHLNITYPKDTIMFEVDGVKIGGHVDGFIGDDTVLEVKSINGMAFKRLDREGLPEDYKKQATSYMKASGRYKTLFIFYCKDTSHLKEILFQYNPDIMQEIYNRFSSVVHSTKENLPEREYGPNQYGKLPWQCSYCSYNKYCWPEAKLSFDKQNKPSLVIGK